MSWGCIDRRESTLKTASRSDYLRKNNQKIIVTNNDEEDILALADRVLGKLEARNASFAFNALSLSA